MIEILSIHVPKTAGTSFRKILTDVYGIEQVQDDYPPYRSYDPTTYKSTDSIKVIHGHFHAIKYKGFFVDAKRVVWLRNPIFRLISEYFYAKTSADTNNKTHLRVVEDNLSLLGFAQILDMQNFMSRQIQQTNLEEFDFVGIQEFYDEDLIELSRLMGWKNFEIPKSNINKAPKYLESISGYFSDSALISSLARLNEQDMNLYDQALSLRALRRKESIDIQAMLSAWSQIRFLSQSFFQPDLRDRVRQKKSCVRSDLSLPTSIKVMSARMEDVNAFVEYFCIDTPEKEVSISNEPILITGWILGKGTRAVSIRIVSHTCIVTETSVDVLRPDVAHAFPDIAHSDRCGFNLILVTKDVVALEDISLQAALSNGVLVEIGSISFPRY